MPQEHLPGIDDVVYTYGWRRPTETNTWLILDEIRRLREEVEELARKVERVTR